MNKIIASDKKAARIILCGAIFLFSCCSLLPKAFAQESDIVATSGFEVIKSFHVSAGISEDSSVLINEKIVYNFSKNPRHGIYRDIPQGDLAIKVISVVDENNTPYNYNTSHESGNLRIKIGDADKYVVGIKTYIITYKVENAIGYFDEFDEFYWNVTGNDWEVAIDQAQIDVFLPSSFQENILQIACYTGLYGSNEKACSFQKLENGSIETMQVRFQSNRVLQAGEGLTIALGWPKGVVASPPIRSQIIIFLKRYGFWLLPIFLFIYLFQLWWRKGRDIELDKTIVVQYDLPNDLKPAEVGYILHQSFTSRSLSATIVDLAVRGYIKIVEKEEKVFFFPYKSWNLVKLKDPSEDNTLEPYEKFLLRKIFEKGDNVSIDSLKKDFYKSFKEMKDLVSEEVTQDDYFTTDPIKSQQKFFIVGFILTVICYLIIGTFGSYMKIASSDAEVLPFLASGLLLVIFGFVMPKKSLKGVDALWHIKGFKEYIKKAEKYRAQFYEKENIFEKYLPYAILFGVTKKWAKAFEGITHSQPNWYVSSSNIATFNAVAFASSLDKSLASMTTSMTSSRSGSGGGGGGGGGGSW